MEVDANSADNILKTFASDGVLIDILVHLVNIW